MAYIRRTKTQSRKKYIQQMYKNNMNTNKHVSWVGAMEEPVTVGCGAIIRQCLALCQHTTKCPACISEVLYDTHLTYTNPKALAGRCMRIKPWNMQQRLTSISAPSMHWIIRRFSWAIKWVELFISRMMNISPVALASRFLAPPSLPHSPWEATTKHSPFHTLNHHHNFLSPTPQSFRVHHHFPKHKCHHHHTFRSAFPPRWSAQGI